MDSGAKNIANGSNNG